MSQPWGAAGLIAFDTIYRERR